MAVKIQLSRWLRRGLGCIVVLFLVGVIGFFSLPWLLVAPAPPPAAQLPVADVLLHWIEFSQTQTDEWIAQLYQQGKVNKVMCVCIPVSWDVYPADFTRQQLIRLGIPAERIETLRLEKEACAVPNIKRVVETVKAKNWQRVLLVTDPMVSDSSFKTYFQQEGLTLTHTCIPAEREELMTQWWKSHRKIQWIVMSGMTRFLDSFYAECR